MKKELKDTIIVERYSQAFFKYAVPVIGFEKVILDCRHIKGIIRENPGFMEFLLSPEITFVDKNNFIEKVLGVDFSQVFKNFLLLLLEKERIDKLPDIVEYIRFNYAHEGEVDVLLKTSFPLDLDLIKEIKEKLAKMFQKKLKFYIDLDGSLLGGIQVVIGNTVIDGSVRRRIEDLKEKLERLRFN